MSGMRLIAVKPDWRALLMFWRIGREDGTR